MIKLYAHPLSSYCQKALIAFYENGIPFEYCMLAPGEDKILAEFAKLWPIKRFPVLADGKRTVFEATIIIEYLGLHYPGAVQLLPADADAALKVRMLDRFFDNYIMTPMQKIVTDKIRAEKDRDIFGVSEARKLLDSSYQWLEENLKEREWIAGTSFTLADCAAAPSLFYADWAHPIPDQFPQLRAYRRRLLARPSVARAVDEARPYRHYFPLGAPDRD